MARRPGVRRASWPIAAADVGGLAAQLGTALLRVPFRRPWAGEGSLPHNLAVCLTRETIRSFMGYSSSLPIEEFRSIELVLDDLCAVVMPPAVRAVGAGSRPDTVAGVPGIWYRPVDLGDEPARGTILYLHGGGYIGTSPRMYAFFTAGLAARTGCEVFVADYRLAPEFPFPAGVTDAALVLEALLHQGRPASRLFVAGDSGGGGLVSSLVYAAQAAHLPRPAGAILFSPEVDLAMDEPSVNENAGSDILPWNIPTAAYLHGTSPESAAVSAVYQDVHHWPPTFVAYGHDEMFRDPVRRFVDHLVAAGVETVAYEEPGMFHVFPILMPWADASRRVMAGIAEFVDKRLSGADGAGES